MISKKAFLLCELIEQHPDIRITKIPRDIPWNWRPIYTVYIKRDVGDLKEIIGDGFIGHIPDGLSSKDLKEIFRTAEAEWNRRIRRMHRDANGEDRDVARFEFYLEELQDA